MGAGRLAAKGVGAALGVLACVVVACHGGAPGHAEPDDGGPGASCDGAPGCDGGATPIHCDLSTKLGRSLTLSDGGTIVPGPESFTISSGAQGSRDIGTVRNGHSQASFAFDFRWDRPGDAPNVIQIPDTIRATTRSLDGTATYAIADRFDADAGHSVVDLYDWPDVTGVNQSAVTAWSTPFAAIAPGPGNLLDTPQGLLYVFTAGSGGIDGKTYLTPAGRDLDLSNPISDIPDYDVSNQGSLYQLSDGSVMVFVDTSVGGDASALELHQLHLPQADSPAVAADSRLFPVSPSLHMFARDGASSADVMIAVEDVANGTYSLYGGVLPESQLFTFDLGSLKKLPTPPVTLPVAPCFALYQGVLTVLGPLGDTGLDLYMFDLASGTVIDSATGAGNLLNGDPNILGCAISPPIVAGSTTTFQLLWTDRADGGETLSYAPLVCGRP